MGLSREFDAGGKEGESGKLRQLNPFREVIESIAFYGIIVRKLEQMDFQRTLVSILSFQKMRFESDLWGQI